MIVLAVVALIYGIAIVTLYDSPDTSLAKTSSELAGTIKYVYNEAAITRQFYRLVIDFENRSFSVEGSKTPFKISASEEGSDPELGQGSEQTNPSSDENSRSSSPPSEAGEATPPENSGSGFSQTISTLLKPLKLPENIRVKDVYVAHYGKKIEGGRTALYFFPNGWVEKAVINLTDEKGELFYSIETFSATGKTKIKNEYFDYKPEEQ